MTAIDQIRERLRERLASRSDEGMTLVELMVAMAVFSILMIIVGVALLPTFDGIRNINNRTTAMNEAQTAIEWISKQLRYTTVAVAAAGATPAKSIVSASTTSVEVYTLSGTGTKNEVPYQVKAFIINDVAAGTRSLVTDTYAMTGTEGNYTRIDSTLTRRVLLKVKTGVEPFRVTVHATCLVPAGCGPSHLAGRDVTTNLTLYENEKYDYVTISVGDQADPKSVISQQIALVNL